ncbi:nucleotidyltransferase family protein [Rhodobacteraceae bacterium N5(2021)]|uniref:Nucleotidyltransferase family protein n=1 Tax=Gymnodinialimonas phycosphaerae TaxID=2841589 RepID=A0A975TX84_9RHOB|nr:nucleotidyltransferase family protein [Gymnodinialimonas phycosphaerae]MBY4892335.1 nucleotidyltransferase family protein [Gymnodinialimonas phycosphaerae]
MRGLIVLLAAGTSSRMRGADKLLESVDDQPLLRLMAKRCVKAGPTRIVLGPDQPNRRAALDGIDVEIVEAEGTDGMAASLRAGVSGLKNQSVMIALADMPEITASDLHLLFSLHDQGLSPIIQAAGEDGTPGQPVVFAPKYLKHLGKLQGDEGARSILKAHARDVALIPLKGDRATTDLDTPEDWATWRAHS